MGIVCVFSSMSPLARKHQLSHVTPIASHTKPTRPLPACYSVKGKHARTCGYCVQRKSIVTRHKTTWFRYFVWRGLFSSSLYSPLASSLRTVTHKTHTYSSGVLCENTSGRVAWVWYCVQRSLAGSHILL